MPWNWTYSRKGRLVQHSESIDGVSIVLKKKMIISIHSEKSLDKIQHPLMMTTLKALGIEMNLINVVKDIYINTILKCEIMDAFPLVLRPNKNSCCHHFYCTTLYWKHYPGQ